jgi:hypothetical protein
MNEATITSVAEASQDRSHSLDDLRAKAEKMVQPSTGVEIRQKRPTFAPPIHPLGEELVMLLYEVGWLSDDDLAIARLWSGFTSPRRGPLRCEGFQLIAGQKREKQKAIWTAQYFDKARVLANTQRQIDETKDPRVLSFLEDARRITEAKAGGWSFGPRWTSYRIRGMDVLKQVHRIVELGHERAMNFLGNPDREMRTAGRYWGHCACCGKALSDPHSIEYGIGPECRRRYDITIRQAPGQWIISGSDSAELFTDKS